MFTEEENRRIVGTITWKWCHFKGLTHAELYALMAARQSVFVVEQYCPYLDADGLDLECWHLLGLAPEGHLLAYLRVIPPGCRYEEPSIGRVLTTTEGRGQGFGRALMEEGIACLRTLYPNAPIRISAQRYLEAFYTSLGFYPVSEPYDEDGIPHVEMLNQALDSVMA